MPISTFQIISQWQQKEFLPDLNKNVIIRYPGL